MLRIFSSSAYLISCLSYDADQIFRRKDKDILQLNLLFTFFMRDFQTKAILVLLFFKFNNAKTKTPSSSTLLSLSPRISDFSNTMQSQLLFLFLLLADFAFFIKTKEFTALCSLPPSPLFYYHRFCIFPTRLPTGSVQPVVWLVSRIYKNLDPSENPNARLADSTKILPRGAYDQINTTKDRYLDVIQMH